MLNHIASFFAKLEHNPKRITKIAFKLLNVDPWCLDKLRELSHCLGHLKRCLCPPEAINDANNYKTLEDLEEADSTITSAIAKLVQIPSEALVYPQAKVKLGEYDQKRAEIRSNIAQEKTAQEKLKEVETIAQKAKQEIDLAKTISQLETVKQKWQEATNKLQEIDNTSLIAKQIGQYQSEYEQQISQIEEKINRIVEREEKLIRDASKNTYSPPKVQTPPRNKIYPQPKVLRPSNQKPVYKKVNPTNPKPIPFDSCAVNNPPSNCRF